VREEEKEADWAMSIAQAGLGIQRIGLM